jgi:ABC-type lipoprotein export system ATPase subunit
MSDPVCELIGVGKSFDGRAVIRDLNLVVEPGEMLAITGPSGSGKSTLLMLIRLPQYTTTHGVGAMGARNPRRAGSTMSPLLSARGGPPCGRS